MSVSPVPLIDAQSVAAKLADGAVVIDVRRPESREKFGTIDGVLIVDRENVDNDFGPDSDSRLPEAKDLDQDIVVLCGSENGSLPVAEKLVALGYTNVSHLRGGFPAWQEAELPVRLRDAQSS